MIQAAPRGGSVIRGSNGMRKLRFSRPGLNRGKSGAYRVFYLNLSERDCFILVTILDKTEEANLTREDINAFTDKVALIKRVLKTGL